GAIGAYLAGTTGVGAAAADARNGRRGLRELLVVGTGRRDVRRPRGRSIGRRDVAGEAALVSTEGRARRRIVEGTERPLVGEVAGPVNSAVPEAVPGRKVEDGAVRPDTVTGVVIVQLLVQEVVGRVVVHVVVDVEGRPGVA